jgi:hypothetical protein
MCSQRENEDRVSRSISFAHLGSIAILIFVSVGARERSSRPRRQPKQEALDMKIKTKLRGGTVIKTVGGGRGCG